MSIMRMISVISAMMMAGQAMAETVFDDFSGNAGARWDYVQDGVMGGVSSGRAEIRGSGPDAVLRLQGTVSTDNNGGFIQVRQRFSENWPKTASGLSLSVRGNGETYYVFLKTPGLSRVWYSYRASFTASGDWQTVRLPFSEFRASHTGMPQSFVPSQVNSIALVAYGADYEADVMVNRVSLYLRAKKDPGSMSGAKSNREVHMITRICDGNCYSVIKDAGKMLL